MIFMLTEQKERSILLLSFISGLFFAIAEFIFSIHSHSQSVLMDAVYDASELIFIALIIFLTPLFHKPVSEKHPYGFFQIESIFIIIKVVMMLAMSLSVSVEIIESAFYGGNSVNSLQISIFQFILGIISIFIYLIMKKMNTKISSPTVESEILEWKIDIAYSIGLSIAFFLSMFLDNTPLSFISPYFDQIVAIVVMILMLPESIKLLWSAIKDIFLFSPDEDIVNNIKDICNEIMAKNDFTPTFFDITRTGRHMWVSIYFEIPGGVLNVKDLKYVNDEVNKKVNREFGNCTCELILVP